MGIGQYDLQQILDVKRQFPHLTSCAILGDCSYNEGVRKEQLGFDIIDTFDINGNPTHKVDLQDPLGAEFEHKYDIIIDPGTLYCVFDIPACLKNIFHMLKPDGVVIHSANLIGHFGRGFYALSPSFFNEFYSANNFDVLSMAYMIKGGGGGWKNMPVGKHYLVQADMNTLVWDDKGTVKYGVPCDTSMLCIVKRNGVGEFSRPIPEHYVKTNGK